MKREIKNKLILNRKEILKHLELSRKAFRGQKFLTLNIKIGVNQLGFKIATRVATHEFWINCATTAHENSESAISFADFFKTIKKIKTDNIALAWDSNTLSVYFANNKINLDSIDLPWGSEFAAENWTSHTLLAKTMSAIAESMGKIISEDNARNYGTGVFVSNLSDTQQEIVATDGFRLARHAVTLPVLQFANVVLPARMLPVFHGLKHYTDYKVSINADKTEIKLDTLLGQLRYKLPAIKYPNYRAVLPGSPAWECCIPKKELIDNLKLCLDFCDKAKNVKLSFKNSEFVLTALNGKEKLPLKIDLQQDRYYSNFEAVYNAKFFLDAINLKNDIESVIVKMPAKPDTPLVISCGMTKTVLVPCR